MRVVFNDFGISLPRFIQMIFHLVIIFFPRPPQYIIRLVHAPKRDSDRAKSRRDPAPPEAIHWPTYSDRNRNCRTAPSARTVARRSILRWRTVVSSRRGSAASRRRRWTLWSPDTQAPFGDSPGSPTAATSGSSGTSTARSSSPSGSPEQSYELLLLLLLFLVHFQVTYYQLYECRV